LKKLGWDKAPVDFQPYEDEAQEYADVVADNEIARWAETDLSMVNEAMLDLGPELDIDLLGIENFVLDLNEDVELDNESIEGREKFDTEIDECADYILLLFRNKKKYDAACKYFNIKSELMQCGHSESEGMQIMMVPRIVEMDKHEF
jgi:hypothetical protein